MFHTRGRMVSFRLSEDEYERLKDLSIMERARSVSDFARSVLCKAPGPQSNTFQDGPDSRLERLEGVVQHVLSELHHVRQLVETIRDRTDDVPSREGELSREQSALS